MAATPAVAGSSAADLCVGCFDGHASHATNINCHTHIYGSAGAASVTWPHVRHMFWAIVADATWLAVGDQCLADWKPNGCWTAVVAVGAAVVTKFANVFHGISQASRTTDQKLKITLDRGHHS